ncbi:hypothetical protein R1flu_005437 [Riccia fluitans]|uniref:NADH dehydrogenase subunit 7 n=1 Tax=Riccia fluitans TaxID=41844 RepID=A0ABD1YTF1_9MARC
MEGDGIIEANGLFLPSTGDRSTWVRRRTRLRFDGVVALGHRSVPRLERRSDVELFIARGCRMLTQGLAPLLRDVGELSRERGKATSLFWEHRLP